MIDASLCPSCQRLWHLGKAGLESSGLESSGLESSGLESSRGALTDLGRHGGVSEVREMMARPVCEHVSQDFLIWKMTRVFKGELYGGWTIISRSRPKLGLDRSAVITLPSDLPAAYPY